MTTLEKYNEIKAAYLSSLKTLSQSVATYDKYEGVLNNFGNFLEQHYTETEQSDISPIMVLNYKEELNKRGVCRNTMRHYLIVLRSFFKWCVQHKFYAEQPILNNDIPKKEEIEYDLLTEPEVYKVLSGEIPKGTKHAKRTRAIVFMFLLTGLRVSELTHLTIKSICMQDEDITIKGKGNKLRCTTLPPLAQKYLRDYIDEIPKQAQNNDSLLFPNRDGKPFTRQNITQVVKKYIEKLVGHKMIGSHDLRHSFASMLITYNVPIPNISSLLGHANWETTAIYASHLCPKKVTAEVNSIFENLPIFS